MASRNKYIKGAYALADQAIVSVVNLCVGISLIEFGEKADYGIFALLFSAIMLVQGLKRAAVLSPYTTAVSQSLNRDYHVLRVVELCIGLTVAVSVLSFAVYLLSSSIAGFDFSFIAAGCFMFAVFGILIRETVRAIIYAEKNARGAFLNNLRFGIVFFICVSILALFGGVSTETTLFSFGVAGMLTSFPLLLRMGKFYWKSFICSGYKYFQFLFKSGRWALQGSLLTWVNTNSYNYLVVFFFGAGAVADVAASRLFWMPIGLLIAGWSSTFKPYISGWFGQHKGVNISRLLAISSILSCFVIAIYALAVTFVFELLVGAGYLSDYLDAKLLLTVWGGVFLVTSLRSIFSAALMVSEIGYKYLSRISLLGFCSLLVSIPFFRNLSLSHVLLVLAVIEGVQLLGCLLVLKRFIPKKLNS